MKLYYVNHIQSNNHSYNIRKELISVNIKLTVNGISYKMWFNFFDFPIVAEIVHYKERPDLTMDFHNNNGPSIINFMSDDRSINYVEYYIDNKAHRVYGPSDIFYDIKGNIKKVRWFYNNNEYTYNVVDWLKENDFNSWEDMTENDYNRMWMEIL